MPCQQRAKVVSEVADLGRYAGARAPSGVNEVFGHVQVEEGGVGDLFQELRVRVCGREVLVEEGSVGDEI